jgi:uncharacterized membrane-anchored protein
MRSLPFTLSCVLALLALSAHAQEEPRRAQLQSLADQIKYQSGDISLRNDLAKVSVPAGFRYVNPAGTETLLTGIWGNPPGRQSTLGLLVPENFDPFQRGAWAVVIGFDEDGYIKDDDADDLNYDDLLKSMKEEVSKASAERVKDGYSTIELVGWAAPPRYDSKTHKFYWAKEIKFGDSPDHTLNYNIRILGRRGVLVLNAVASVEQLHEIEAAAPTILSMVEFNSGQRYSDFTPGTDKVATYGLAALVAGGVAAKAGFFKGLIALLLAAKKFIFVGIAAVMAFLRRLFGGKPQQEAVAAIEPSAPAEPDKEGGK